MSGFSITRRLRSFLYAFQGAKVLFGTQPNAWIHAAATAAVIAGGLAFHVSGHEWALLVLAMALVWMAEALNTAIEFVADEVSVEKRARLGQAKDVGAFGVLVAAAASVVVGAIVFAPYLLALI